MLRHEVGVLRLWVPKMSSSRTAREDESVSPWDGYLGTEVSQQVAPRVAPMSTRPVVSWSPRELGFWHPQVTRGIEELLERQLERMRPRSAHASTNDFEFHKALLVTDEQRRPIIERPTQVERPLRRQILPQIEGGPPAPRARCPTAPRPIWGTQPPLQRPELVIYPPPMSSSTSLPQTNFRFGEYLIDITNGRRWRTASGPC
jgi:hypothetical protein